MSLQCADGVSAVDSSLKRVAVVEDFFDIIYAMHVEISSDPGKAPKHAGQKKTYKAVSAALPASCPLWLSVVFTPRTTLPPLPCSPFLSFTTRAVCCFTRAPLSPCLFLFFGLHSSLSVSGQRAEPCNRLLSVSDANPAASLRPGARPPQSAHTQGRIYSQLRGFCFWL